MIQDVTQGRKDPKLFSVRATNGRLHDPNEVIFPILRSDDDDRLRLVGTGFFVSRLGWFVSARHVFESVLDRHGRAIDALSILHFLEGNRFHHRPVIGFVVHPSADVGVGVCASMSHVQTREPLYNKVLTLSRRIPKVGDPAWTYAYPGTTLSAEIPQNVRITPGFYAGEIMATFPEGRDRVLLPSPCYQTSMPIHRAASGGPVFGIGGAVIGINSTGFDGETDVSFVSRILDAMSLGVPNVVMPTDCEPRVVSLNNLAAIGHVSLI